MSKLTDTMKPIYSDLALDINAEPVIDFSNPFHKDYEKEEKWLEELDEIVADGAGEQLLLSALKAELLSGKEPESAYAAARAIISGSPDNPDDELIRQARGIAFYLLAFESDENNGFNNNPETLRLYRAALDLFPGHWNCAVIYADHVLNDSALFGEAIRYLENALKNNDDQNIKNKILRQSAAISEGSKDTQAVIKFYESAKENGDLNYMNVASLARAYAREELYAEALANFGDSWRLEKEHIARHREKKQWYSHVTRGFSAQILWDLTSQMVAEYKKESGVTSKILVAMCFFYLPALFADEVIKDLREKLTNQSEVRHLAEIFGFNIDMGLPQEIQFTDEEFIRMSAKATVEINRRLIELQPGVVEPLQVPKARFKRY